MCVTNTDSFQCLQFFGGSECSEIEMKNDFQRPGDPTKAVYIARLQSNYHYTPHYHFIVDESVAFSCSYLNQVDITCSCGKFKMTYFHSRRNRAVCHVRIIFLPYIYTTLPIDTPPLPYPKHLT